MLPSGLVWPGWRPNGVMPTAGIQTSFGTMRLRGFGRPTGIEGARILLGHSSVVTSELYAEIDWEKAKEMMAKMG
jgi:hypothetical protein